MNKKRRTQLAAVLFALAAAAQFLLMTASETPVPTQRIEIGEQDTDHWSRQRPQHAPYAQRDTRMRPTHNRN